MRNVEDDNLSEITSEEVVESEVNIEEIKHLLSLNNHEKLGRYIKTNFTGMSQEKLIKILIELDEQTQSKLMQAIDLLKLEPEIQEVEAKKEEPKPKRVERREARTGQYNPRMSDPSDFKVNMYPNNINHGKFD